MILIWKPLVRLKQLLRHPLTESRFTEYRGYRKAVGGRWGLWEADLHGLFKIWLPSACEHFPRPPLVTHTEPLKTEDYT